MSPHARRDARSGGGLIRPGDHSSDAVGTSGSRSDYSAGVATIRDWETITGTNDGHELVGRRVDLLVPVDQHINDVALWVGPKDNHILVVLARDSRPTRSLQDEESASTDLALVRAGQRATVTGTIQRVPHPEGMYSWGLTNADRRDLMERPIYLKADAVGVLK
jgi:hypothetical protein